jgi:protein gp37
MTKIEWVRNADGSQGKTWNPIVGCSIVSPGCTNCYAMKMAARIEAMGNQPRYAGTTRKVNGNAIWTGKLAQAPESALLAPLKRKIPTVYFVNSMGDLFHEDCPDEDIDLVLAVAAMCSQHTLQILTKRATRMRVYMRTPHRKQLIAERVMDVSNMLAKDAGWKARIKLDDFSARFTGSGPFKNIWLGVSAERQQEANERIPELLATPAAVRFISAEPLLGPIDLSSLISADGEYIFDATSGQSGWRDGETWEPSGCGPKLDWVIVGGESGPGARPMHSAWARSLRDQCAAAGMPFFFKQWGEYGRVGDQAGVDHLPEDADVVTRVGKKAAGRLLDGVQHNGMPAVRA